MTPFGWRHAFGHGHETREPPLPPRELDCDVLIAAQALTLGEAPGELVVATTNVGPLQQFVPAAAWRSISAE